MHSFVLHALWPLSGPHYCMQTLCFLSTHCLKWTAFRVRMPALTATSPTRPRESVSAEPTSVSTSSPRVGVVYDEVMMKHKNEYYVHPEQPARISKIYDELAVQGCLDRCISTSLQSLSGPLPGARRVAGRYCLAGASRSLHEKQPRSRCALFTRKAIGEW